MKKLTRKQEEMQRYDNINNTITVQLYTTDAFHHLNLGFDMQTQLMCSNEAKRESVRDYARMQWMQWMELMNKAFCEQLNRELMKLPKSEQVKPGSIAAT